MPHRVLQLFLISHAPAVLLNPTMATAWFTVSTSARSNTPPVYARKASEAYSATGIAP